MSLLIIYQLMQHNNYIQNPYVLEAVLPIVVYGH